MLTIVDGTRDRLLAYVTKQLETIIPDGESNISGRLSDHFDEALERLEPCIGAVRMFPEGKFDYMHTSQYTVFLYYLANTIWRRSGDTKLPRNLFLLNKALNGIDMYYEIQMPDVFFVGHSVGIVLAKATYGNYLVLYQNSTIGKNHGIAPVVGSGVVMYPNTAIIGSCQIGDRTVVSQGVSVINQDTPGNCVVYQGERGMPVFATPQRDILGDIFRL